LPSPPLIDPTAFDVSRVLFGPDRIREVNPQRDEFEMLSGILRCSPDDDLCVGFRDVRGDEFWARGHLPGRPIFPGVLLIEAAAQLCTFFWGMRTPPPQGHFFGFAGVDEVRFRGVVAPPCRLVFAARLTAARSRYAQWDTQAFVGAERVFEGKVFGVVV
jgi:3-hydroxyacyl-[acyl-carrier-protein] dehydratase